MTPYLLVLPLLVGIVGVTYVPLGKSIALSVTNTSLLAPNSANVGLANFTMYLGSQEFWATLLRTLAWTFLSVAGALIVGVSAALLVHSPGRGRRFIRPALILPWVAPPVATAFIWAFLYRNNGPIAPLARSLHITHGLVDMLGDVGASFAGLKLPMWAVIQVGIWSGFPFVFLFTLSALSSIPQEVKEAAALDGARGWSLFRHVTLPMIAPVLETAAVLLALIRFGGFDVPYLLTQGGPETATTVFGVKIYNTFFSTFNLGQGAALGLLLFAFALPLSAAYVLRARKQLAD